MLQPLVSSCFHPWAWSEAVCGCARHVLCSLLIISLCDASCDREDLAAAEKPENQQREVRLDERETSAMMVAEAGQSYTRRQQPYPPGQQQRHRQHRSAKHRAPAEMGNVRTHTQQLAAAAAAAVHVFFGRA